MAHTKDSPSCFSLIRPIMRVHLHITFPHNLSDHDYQTNQTTTSTAAYQEPRGVSLQQKADASAASRSFYLFAFFHPLASVSEIEIIAVKRSPRIFHTYGERPCTWTLSSTYYYCCCFRTRKKLSSNWKRSERQRRKILALW